MARGKKRYHKKSNGARSMVKKIAGIGAVGVGAVPAVLPVVKAGQSFAGGANVEAAVNSGLGVVGLNTSGTVDWKKATAYGMFTVGCYGAMIGLRMLARKL